MPKTTNDKILDSVFIRAVDLSRFEVKVQQEIRKVLRDTQNNILKDVVDIKTDPTTPKTLRGKLARLEALQKQINQTVNTGTSKIKRRMTSNLNDVAQNENALFRSTVKASLPSEVAPLVNTVALSAGTLETIANETLIDGYTGKEWWNSLGTDIKQKFKRTVREGVVRGESVDGIVKRLKGTGAGTLGYETFQRNAKTLVRSSISAVSNTVAENIYAENSDIISALKWVSTLDSRTTEFCISRDNKLYTVDTHEPIGHSYSWENGPGKSHFSCRSRSSPVLKSAKELGLDDSNSTRRARDVVGGEVPADTNYVDWLKKQSKKTQDKVLGKTKAELWRTGQVKSFRDLVDQTGRPKPLAELPKLKE